MSDRTPIQFPPGVYRQGSEAEMEGRWYASHLVRWVDGVLRPIGGWEKIITSAAFVGTIRATHVWVTRAGLQLTAILTESHLYVMTTAGAVTDITPVDGIAVPADTHVGGYGTWNYGTGLYDEERPDRPDDKGIGPMWSLDNFGDDLLAMASTDGRLLRWKPTDPPGTLATRATDSPIGRCFVVTPERHVMIFWISDKFNSFGWCSQEDVEDWAAGDVTNTAGYYDIEPASPFITAVSTRFGVIAFTAVGAYFIRYLGVPYIYSYEYLGYYSAPVAGSAVAQTANMVFWYSSDGFWVFDGQGVQPLPCSILDWIQRTIDPIVQYRRVAGLFIGTQSEVWFFFPHLGQSENTHYALYNFDEKWWAMGRLSRTCGTPGSTLTYPIMSDGTNLYLHEKGLFYYDAPELPYAQSAGIQIADGARMVTARKGVVDTRAPAEDVVFTIAARKDRISNGTEAKRSTGARIVRPNGGKLDFRITGRELTIRIQSARSGVQPWTFGKMLVRLAPRGGR